MSYDLTSGYGNNGIMNDGGAFTTLQHSGGAAFLGNTGQGSTGTTITILRNFLDSMKQGGATSKGYSWYYFRCC